MTQIDLEDWLTSLSGDTPASHSRLPGSDEAIKMTDTSGRKCLELSKLSGRLGLLEKMLLDTSLWASTRCYLTWKGKATPQGRSLFQLVPLTHLTDETEVGSSPEMWATPDAEAASRGGTLKRGKRPSGARRQVSINDQVKMWPTPNASDNRDRGCMEDPSIQRRIKIGKQIGLSTAVKETRQAGTLNPTWVEWLMGFPIGHTDLNA